MVEIRRVSAADADEIGRFQTRAWQDSYRGILADAYLDAIRWEDRADRWRVRLEGGRIAWAAVAGGRIVGVASILPTAAERPDLPPVELATLYVDVALHGSGLARQLLQTALGGAAAHLWVFAANVRAQRFYAKHRFVPSAELRDDPETGVAEVRWVRSEDHLPAPDGWEGMTVRA